MGTDVPVGLALAARPRLQGPATEVVARPPASSPTKTPLVDVALVETAGLLGVHRRGAVRAFRATALARVADDRSPKGAPPTGQVPPTGADAVASGVSVGPVTRVRRPAGARVATAMRGGRPARQTPRRAPRQALGVGTQIVPPPTDVGGHTDDAVGGAGAGPRVGAAPVVGLPRRGRPAEADGAPARVAVKGRVDARPVALVRPPRPPFYASPPPVARLGRPVGPGAVRLGPQVVGRPSPPFRDGGQGGVGRLADVEVGRGLRGPDVAPRHAGPPPGLGAADTPRGTVEMVADVDAEGATLGPAETPFDTEGVLLAEGLSGTQGDEGGVAVGPNTKRPSPRARPLRPGVGALLARPAPPGGPPRPASTAVAPAPGRPLWGEALRQVSDVGRHVGPPPETGAGVLAALASAVRPAHATARAGTS